MIVAFLRYNNDIVLMWKNVLILRRGKEVWGHDVYLSLPNGSEKNMVYIYIYREKMEHVIHV